MECIGQRRVGHRLENGEPFVVTWHVANVWFPLVLAQNHPVNPRDRGGWWAKTRKFALCGIPNLRSIDVGRVLTWRQWNDEAKFDVLTYVGGARIDALAIPGPRHGDPPGQEKSRRLGVESEGSWTDPKKHCAEDLREQADRPATSSALAVVQAPGDSMTPVVPPPQLSSEANATVAAINGELEPTMLRTSLWPLLAVSGVIDNR